mmetsp:Transcript_11870/g.15105  ORF Transcript_11870/g.15105 Transcript_11870/m.15105 type:complete len:96 (+) Transcript_11870:42-329(+)
MKACFLKVCPCCTGKNPHIVFSIVGLSISTTAIILASVYNFHSCGFALDLIGLLSSALYLYLSFRELRQQKLYDAVNDGENLLNQLNGSGDTLAL